MHSGFLYITLLIFFFHCSSHKQMATIADPKRQLLILNGQ